MSKIDKKVLWNIGIHVLAKFFSRSYEKKKERKKKREKGAASKYAVHFGSASRDSFNSEFIDAYLHPKPVPPSVRILFYRPYPLAHFQNASLSPRKLFWRVPGIKRNAKVLHSISGCRTCASRGSEVRPRLFLFVYRSSVSIECIDPCTRRGEIQESPLFIPDITRRQYFPSVMKFWKKEERKVIDISCVIKLWFKFWL